MGLKGKFEWYQSMRQGGRKDISFTLTCDNVLQSETFDCAIIASQGLRQPMVFRQLKLKPKYSLSFNFDTVDWQWCDGDIFVLLDSQDNIIQQWPLQFQAYRPGECPECHGTKTCGTCRGKGYVNLPNYRVEKCTVCGGTGICQTCYIPQRSISNTQGVSPANYGSNQVDPEKAKAKEIARLRNRMSDLQNKIEKTEWDLRMMRLRNQDVTSFGSYSSFCNLLYRYQSQLIDVQSKLEQMENL